MFKRIVVPIDGSDFSWRAFGPALSLAVAGDAALEVVEVVTLPDDRGLAEKYVRERLAGFDGVPDDVEVTILVMGETIPETIAAHVEPIDGTVVVMSSVGRGRSAALIGSVAEELLHEMFGPVVVVGPDVDVEAWGTGGDVLVAVDGSEASELMLPLAASWAMELGTSPWVVTVADPDDHPAGDVAESSYPARLARKLAGESHHPVEFEVLRHHHPATAIAEFATDIGASLVFASTHGRTGVARMTVGSVAMAIVRHSPCPVVLARPPRVQ